MKQECIHLRSWDLVQATDNKVMFFLSIIVYTQLISQILDSSMVPPCT